MATVISYEAAKRGTSQYKVELNSGETFLVGFSSTAPIQMEPKFSDILASILNEYDKGRGDMFSYISRRLVMYNCEMPLYIMPDRNEERLRIGRRIRQIREGKKLEANKLARLTDIDPANLSRIEQGKFSPGLDTLCKIAMALDAYVDIIPNQPSFNPGSFSLTRSVWILPNHYSFDPLTPVPAIGHCYWPQDECENFAIGDLVIFCSQQLMFGPIAVVGEVNERDPYVPEYLRNEIVARPRDSFSYATLLMHGDLDIPMAEELIECCKEQIKEVPNRAVRLNLSSFLF